MSPNSYLDQILEQEEIKLCKTVEQFCNHHTTFHLAVFHNDMIHFLMSRLLFIRYLRDNYV